jgi:cellulose synthase/poly-beta-1,6-N-acetylglucosamine synthase-like glycosyltransferase
MKSDIKYIYKLFVGYIQTLLILLLFFFVVCYYYTAPLLNVYTNAIISIIALSVLTDGIFLLLHLFRKPVKHKDLSYDPEKLTIVIACYNGQDIIGDTIKDALVHVRPDQIIVVSDASTDNTAQTARAYGVRVVENEKNVNKAFSISFVMHKVTTPYVLILDDDTLIGKTFIPTSLLDEGYDGVAFNVMPLKTNSLINALQRFEYRKSMVIGKSLRGSTGAVGNISGAIGLYKTKDLMEQVTKHSGQFGGEDQQRTALVHLYGTGKGVTYTDATVLTKAPDTVKQLCRQRAFRWNVSLPELLFVNLRIVINPNFPYLLKAEIAYQLYLWMTDPIRMLFFWVLFLNPYRAIILYLFYVFLTFLVWLKLQRKDPLWIILIFPLYRILESACRFTAHFYWFKIKYNYLFRHKFHKLVPDRKLALEYTGVFLVIASLWNISMHHFEEASVNSYVAITEKKYRESIAMPARTAKPKIPFNIIETVEADAPDMPITPEEKSIAILVENGDSKSKVARKAVHSYMGTHTITLTTSQQLVAEDGLRKNMPQDQRLITGQIVELDCALVEKYVSRAAMYY